MKRLLLPGDLKGLMRHVLDTETSFHILKVLRLRRGTVIEAMDEAGNRFSATLAGVKEGRALLDLSSLSAGTEGIESENAAAAAELQAGENTDADFDRAISRSREPIAFPRIALVQGLPKSQKMDLIVRQAVEVGVELILPLQTRYSVVRELGREGSGGGPRRERILKEALQQSGSLVRTRLASTCSVEELGARLVDEGFPPETSLYLMFHEQDIAKLSLHERCAGATGAAVILVGPEGGFSPEETQLCIKLGFSSTHIPGSVLRTETAALYAIAAVKTLLMEKNLWTLSK